jgi:hypothetical protein
VGDILLVRPGTKSVEMAIGSGEWRVNAANAGSLAATLCREWENALLFRRLAHLRTDIRLFDDVDELRWRGPTSAFDAVGVRLDAARIQRAGPAKTQKANGQY